MRQSHGYCSSRVHVYGNIPSYDSIDIYSFSTAIRSAHFGPINWNFVSGHYNFTIWLQNWTTAGRLLRFVKPLNSMYRALSNWMRNYSYATNLEFQFSRKREIIEIEGFQLLFALENNNNLFLAIRETRLLKLILKHLKGLRLSFQQ